MFGNINRRDCTTDLPGNIRFCLGFYKVTETEEIGRFGAVGIINRSETVGNESHGISNIRSGGIGYPHVNYFNKDIGEVGVKMRDNIVWIKGSHRSIWEPDGLDYNVTIQCIGGSELI